MWCARMNTYLDNCYYDNRYHGNLSTPVQELDNLQGKHSTRPDIFDDVEEEHAIDILTAEITQV